MLLCIVRRYAFAFVRSAFVKYTVSVTIIDDCQNMNMKVFQIWCVNCILILCINLFTSTV